MQINVNSLTQNLSYQEMFVEIMRDTKKELVSFEEYEQMMAHLKVLKTFNKKVINSLNLKDGNMEL